MVEKTKAGFLDRTLRNLRNAWQGIAGAEWDAEAASLRPDLPEDDLERLRTQMRACLERRGGEASARARAAALGRAYLALDAEGRKRFLRVLAEDFDTDHARVAEIAMRLGDGIDAEETARAESDLRRALEPPRVRLLTQFNALPEGIKFLVDLRAELMTLARGEPALRPVEQDLKAILAHWFDVDLLELRRITWNNASAALLERLIVYEAVHAIQSWDDLKNRLASDRRCFAFFHPAMRDEPLIFVEVALVNGLAGNVQELLDETAPLQDPKRADSAIFYSISNAQRGLAGISFGDFLIKRVADSLAAELPQIKTFATLSPIPGFRAWLESTLADGEPNLLLAPERKAITAALGRASGAKGNLKALLEREGWLDDPVAAETLKAPLMRLCARYLYLEKGGKGRALDPVAHFHLSNGARMERLNWRADTSPQGVARACGMMVNYLYKLDEIEANHETYTGEGAIRASSVVRGLVKG